MAVFIFFTLFKFISSQKNFNQDATVLGLRSLRTAVNLYYGEHGGRFPSKNIAEELIENGYLDSIPYNYIGDKSNKIITSDFEDNQNLGGWCYKAPGSDEYPQKKAGSIWINSSKKNSENKLWSDL
jgi:hypothetical protein